MFCPCVTVAGAVLITATSALGAFTVSVAVEALLPGFGSLVVLVTVAVLLRTVGATVAVAVSVNVAVAPLAKLAHVAVEVVPPVVVAAGPEVWTKLTNVALAGSVSDNCTLAAASGPALLTVSV